MATVSLTPEIVGQTFDAFAAGIETAAERLASSLSVPPEEVARYPEQPGWNPDAKAVAEFVEASLRLASLVRKAAADPATPNNPLKVLRALHLAEPERAENSGRSCGMTWGYS